ncbi:choice-of-anchor D domain-containing protein [Granulicella arctica]|uniref:choice-of-anchor D domain-containing protein n=1 Tax=Granulicella arctica TaxID=940613 RepID=UPI0021E0CBBC|nr:choice-of-anchor D domain-containing protein [Granulicella arctica]
MPLASMTSMIFSEASLLPISQSLTVMGHNSDGITAVASPAVFTVAAVQPCLQGIAVCQLAITFTPKGPGTVAGSLLLTDMATGLVATVPLTGTDSLATSAPVVTPASLSFTAPIGGTTPLQLAIVNSPSGDPISAQLTASSTSFHLPQASTCGSGVPICQIPVQFRPASAGTFAGSLLVTDTITGLSSAVNLSGVGTAPPPPPPVAKISVSISSVTFADTGLGSTIGGQPITVTSSGTAPLIISAIVLTGADAGEFAEKGSCLATLQPGASCTLAGSFSPAASGTRTGAIQILSNVAASPTVIQLTGNGTGVPTNQLIPGAIANIPFTEGAGSVARDTSGLGNDCTFSPGGNTPTWVNGGLQMNDNLDGNQRSCVLPASSTLTDSSTMNSRTLTMCAYFHPLDAPNNVGYATAFGGSNRQNVGALWLAGAAHPRSAYYMGDYFGFGGEQTYTNQPLVGYNCITYALGSNLDGTVDHFYINGAEVSQYGSQLNVWDGRAVGDSYTVGALPWDGGGLLWGTVYYVLAYPTQLNAASIAHNNLILQQSAFYSRGLGALHVQSTTTANVLVVDGDSLTNETPGDVTPYPYLLNLTTPFTVTDTGVAGSLLETNFADAPLVDLPLYSPNSKFAIVSDNAAINDLDVGGSSAPAIIANRMRLYALYKQSGFTVIAPTMLSSLNMDVPVQSISAGVRAMSVANGYYVVDWQNEPCLGAVGAYANPVCNFFQGDGIHPSQAGENEMAALYSNVVNYITGATAADPTVVTAATYGIAPADRFLSTQGTTSQVLTLPSCYGWSTTTPFTISNVNTSGNVTLSASGGFLLNDASVPVVVPGRGSIQVYADIVSQTASGCAWHTK